MPKIAYDQIVGNRELLVNLLVKRNLPMHVVAHSQCVPYECVKNQAKKLLTDQEYEKVIANRPRRTFDNVERLMIISHAQMYGSGLAGVLYNVNQRVIAKWVKRHRQRHN